MPCVLRAQQPEGVLAVITEPAAGQQLFGQVTIQGSAAHPTAFESFTLEYDDLSDPAVQWLLVQPRIQQQVENDTLGSWNTNMVSDGVYQLRLRVFLSDGQIGEYIVNSVRVINSAPTPLPTTDTVVAPLEPTPGPSPTSPIVQPPSNQPDNTMNGFESSVTTGLDQSPTFATTGNTRTTTRINTGRIGQAFCSGVYLTLAAFGAMFFYILLRRRLRPIARQLLWQMRDDLDRQ